MKRIWTIGHSTRDWGAFADLLRHHGIAQLADVRSYPGSRRHPHFARAALEAALPENGIAYRWMRALGGRRRPDPDSTANAAWRVEAFRAYADYMATDAFRAALAELEAWASAASTAYMCAEAIHSRCHRWLISDALVARGWSVLHMRDERAPAEHVLTDFARVDSRRQLTYPGQGTLPLEDAGDA